MSIALSTSWNAARSSDGEAIIDEIRALGFKEIELSFNLTPQILAGITKAISKSGIKVVSAHNFCPIPEGIERERALPDCFSMASTDEAQRQQAVKQTKISVDTVAGLGAGALVLHCGRIEMPDHTRDLIALYDKDAKDSQEYTNLKDEILKERSALIKPYLENTLRSLGEISVYATKRHIKLGIENRFYIREIPSFDEIGVILNEFKDANVFYWHDSGHAQVFENLGIVVKHEDYLKAYKDELAGFHLHNVLGCVDHQAPLKGMIDFNMIKPYAKATTFKVIESHSLATTSELIEGWNYLRSLLDTNA